MFFLFLIVILVGVPFKELWIKYGLQGSLIPSVVSPSFMLPSHFRQAKLTEIVFTPWTFTTYLKKKKKIGGKVKGENVQISDGLSYSMGAKPAGSGKSQYFR